MKNTNYEFDKYIFENSPPLVKDVISKNYYRIDVDNECSMEPLLFNLNVSDILISLMKSKKYNIKVVEIIISSEPNGTLRMNNTELDNIFNNANEIKCNTAAKFIIYQKRHNQRIEMMNINPDFKIYNFYYSDQCTNYNVFLDNVSKYPNQIIPIKLNNKMNIPHGRQWIVKYKNYYYIISEISTLQRHSLNHKEERYLIFKKLTLEQLMQYDNGSYWKLIKEYNIKID